LTASGIQRRIEVRTMNFSSIPQSIIGTKRIATVPRRLALIYADYLPLRILEPPYPLPKLTEAVQWHTRFDEDPATMWLRGILRAVADEDATR
jgi:DNA-binding transcriptional LysR family regulator